MSKALKKAKYQITCTKCVQRCIHCCNYENHWAPVGLCLIKIQISFSNDKKKRIRNNFRQINPPVAIMPVYDDESTKWFHLTGGICVFVIIY